MIFNFIATLSFHFWYGRVKGHVALFLGGMIWALFQQWRSFESDSLILQSFSYTPPDWVLKEATYLASLLGIWRTADRVSIVSSIVMYAQAHSSRSIFTRFVSSSSVTEEFVRMSLNDIIPESEGDEWISELRNVMTDWRRIRNCKHGTNIALLISYAISLGFCEKESMEFKIGNLSLFAPTVLKKQLNAFDVFEAASETVISFIEGGWHVYKTGKVSAFLCEEASLQHFEQLFNSVRSKHGFAITGNLKQQADIDDGDYISLIEKAIKIGDELSKKTPPGAQKVFFTSRTDRLRDWLCEFEQLRLKGGLRKAPFGYSLHGNSSVGKSTLHSLTYRAIGAYNKIDVSDNRVGTWEDNCKFADNIRSSTNVIYFDDFANVLPKWMDFSPCDRLVKCVNNCAVVAPMAEAFMKGKVMLFPKIVGITTNVKHLNAHVFSAKPESILRRFYHVHVVVKPEFSRDGKLDTEKVFEVFGSKPDAPVWKLTVTYVVIGAQIDMVRSHYDWAVHTFNGKRLENIELSEYLQWVQEESKRMYEMQDKLMNSLQHETKLCESCGFAYCKCASNEEFTIPLTVDNEIQDAVINEEDVIPESMCGRFVMRLFFRIALFLILWIITYIRWSLYIFSAWGYASVVDRLFGTNTAAPFLEFAWDFMGYDRIYIWVMRSLYNLGLMVRTVRMYVYRVSWTIREESTVRIIQLLSWYEAGIVFDIFAWMPSEWVSDHRITLLWMYCIRWRLFDRWWKVLALYCYYLAVALLWICKGWVYSSLIVLFLSIIILAVQFRIEYDTLREEMLHRNDAGRSMRNFVKMTFGALLLGTTVYGLVKTINALRSFLSSSVPHSIEVDPDADEASEFTPYDKPQPKCESCGYTEAEEIVPEGNLSPRTVEEAEARLREKDMWAEAILTPCPRSKAGLTTTPADLAGLVEKAAVTVVREGKRGFVGGFILCSNVIVIPKHSYNAMVAAGDKFFRVYVGPANMTVPNFRGNLSNCYVCPDHDFVFIWVPQSGSRKNLVPFLTPSLSATFETLFIHQYGRRGAERERTYARRLNVSTTNVCDGFGYFLNTIETADGSCMSPHVLMAKGTGICGFHIGVQASTGEARAIHLPPFVAESAIRYFAGRSSTFQLAEEGDMPDEIYGKKLVERKSIHPKSAVNYLTPDPTIAVFGETSGRVKATTSVVQSAISDLIYEEFGQPNEWGPPPINKENEGIYPHQAALDKLSHPAMDFGPELDTAIEDYKIDLWPVLEMYKDKSIRPLSHLQTINGVPGVKFLDRMKMSTSPGWPLNGPKRDQMVCICEEDDIYDFVPEIKDRIKEVLDQFRQGKRAYSVWKACLKDEVLKKSKKKVRVFQSAPIELQYILRKYFLPLIRILQSHPLVTECAVGVNAEGPEWEQLHKFMTKFENLFNGDYKFYDQTLAASLTQAVFRLLIDMAEFLGYSEEDLTIMRAAASEVCNPVMAFNGDLVMIFGSNPSGQNLTVIVNSIANALLLRMGFKEFYPDLKYRDHCNINTYGDDNGGSVDSKVSKFNCKSFAEFVSRYGMVFTPPDKSPEFKDDYVKELDFLKRKSYYCPHRDCVVGQLEKSSIFKRLHNYLDSGPLTPDQHCAENINASMRDLAFYPPEEYEEFRVKLSRVAEKAGIRHLCTQLNIPYEQQVRIWKEKYDDDLQALRERERAQS